MQRSHRTEGGWKMVLEGVRYEPTWQAYAKDRLQMPQTAQMSLFVATPTWRLERVVEWLDGWKLDAAIGAASENLAWCVLKPGSTNIEVD